MAKQVTTAVATKSASLRCDSTAIRYRFSVLSTPPPLPDKHNHLITRACRRRRRRLCSRLTAPSSELVVVDAADHGSEAQGLLIALSTCIKQ